MISNDLKKLSWEALAVRWGNQLMELMQGVNAVFPDAGADLHTKGIDRPSDILLAIAKKIRDEETTH